MGPIQSDNNKQLITLTMATLSRAHCTNIYIYKRLRPRKKNPQQKKRKSRKSNFL